MKGPKKRLAVWIINKAAKEQGLYELRRQLEEIQPAIENQYTSFTVDNDYLYMKVKNIHACQIKLVLKTLKFIKKINGIRIVDIGDSSGTHLNYIKNILSKRPDIQMRDISLVGINSDPIAVRKIKEKGIDGKLCRAEEFVKRYEMKSEIFISFEMLEHLTDPISFLNDVSRFNAAKFFVLTVPYVSNSRVGLRHLRNPEKVKEHPETIHIFELSPSDWTLIFRFSGWKIIYDEIYYQYPKKSILRFSKYFWKNRDFEGFYGAILKRDRTFSMKDTTV